MLIRVPLDNVASTSLLLPNLSTKVISRRLLHTCTSSVDTMSRMERVHFDKCDSPMGQLLMSKRHCPLTTGKVKALVLYRDVTVLGARDGRRWNSSSSRLTSLPAQRPCNCCHYLFSCLYTYCENCWGYIFTSSVSARRRVRVVQQAYHRAQTTPGG